MFSSVVGKFFADGINTKDVARSENTSKGKSVKVRQRAAKKRSQNPPQPGDVLAADSRKRITIDRRPGSPLRVTKQTREFTEVVPFPPARSLLLSRIRQALGWGVMSGGLATLATFAARTPYFVGRGIEGENPLKQSLANLFLTFWAVTMTIFSLSFVHQSYRDDRKRQDIIG